VVPPVRYGGWVARNSDVDIPEATFVEKLTHTLFRPLWRSQRTDNDLVDRHGRARRYAKSVP
jgi:hypothetical protein